MHLDDDSLLAELGIRQTLATELYRDRRLSLGQAARFSGVSIAEFQHVSRLGTPVVVDDGETIHNAFFDRGFRG